MTSHHITIHSTRGERIQEGRRHNPYTEAGEGDPFFKLIARFAIEQTGGAALCALDMGSSRRSLWGVMGEGDSWHVYVTVIYCIRMEHGKRFSIRFPLDLLETLKKLAQEDKRSINGEIVWILSEYVKHRKGAKRS